jgi:hypothetical protein
MAILRGFERPGTAIVDHPVIAVLSPFRLTPPIASAFIPSPAIPAFLPRLSISSVSAPNTIPCLLCLSRPSS